MNEDDELRDALGADITAVLFARASADPTTTATTTTTTTMTTTTAETVQRRARTTRVRRRAAVVALAVVVAAGGVGTFAATRGHASGVRVATSPTEPAPTTVAAPTPKPGHKIVSYRGVHVEVPTSWPVVDGMHTGFCGPAFPKPPTAFIGPQENGPPSCPPMIPPPPTPDGVWLVAEPRPADAHPKRLASGITVLSTTYETGTEDVWYRGVVVIIGIGPDHRVATAILESIGYTAGLADTPRAGVCARGDSKPMPTPERLVKTLYLEHGNQTLRPPEPGDRAAFDPERLWNPYEIKESFERYRVILARYTARLPAHQLPNGTLVPFYQHHLAWVIYASPRSPEIQGCGMWGTSVFDAQTGRAMGSGGYSPGP